MAIDDLPVQAPLRLAEGQAYGERVLERSRPVLASRHGLFDQPFGDDYYQKLDVFLPDGQQDEPLPVLMFAHGGSWIAGYKEWMAFMAPAITALPAIFVSVSYRLAPKTRHPGLYDDCVSALKWVYDHADAIGADRSRLFVGGHSAGGHLMALVATNNAGLVARGLPADVVKGCIPVSASFDVRLASPSLIGTSHAHQVLLADPADADSASPIASVSAKLPPFLITVGEFDFPRLRDQGLRMAEALLKAGVQMKFLDLPGHDHFDTSERSVDSDHPWLKNVARMLGEHEKRRG